ncbi:hypothetical protein GCM10010415_44010 [Streptomyces atrovirens]|uniref:Uncharacterized protein n=1 Tax=Streptomyces atrovirens TaxID=285556 RepID=A0ABW0DRV0_9ACTN
MNGEPAPVGVRARVPDTDAVRPGDGRQRAVRAVREVLDLPRAPGAGTFPRPARQTDRPDAARAVVERVQRPLLPSPPRRVGDLEPAARHEAAHGEARPGGDLYAVRATRSGTRVLLGDVRGKGHAVAHARH